MDFWAWLGVTVSLFIATGVAVSVWLKRKHSRETPFLLLQQQLDGLRTEIRSQSQNQLELLQKSHQGIDQRLDNASKFFGGMESKIVKMEAATQQVISLSKDITDLQQILKAPKLRGNFSEQLLGDLLAQMIPQDNFHLQYTFSNGERVDAVIKTAERMVPIDAKFPLENFRRMVEAQNEEEKKSLRRQFIIDVRKHIDDISKKYILPAEGTFDFALMYIPAESVYYEIITRDISGGENSSLIDYALKKTVIPVSPNTFFAYLETIRLGLRGMQIQGRVREILAEMGRARKELSSFRIDFARMGKHLSDALSSFGKSEKRLTRLEGQFEALETSPAPESLPPPPAS